MCRYHWPGNARELMAAIMRMKLRAAGREVISIEQVREEIKPNETNTPSQYALVWRPGRPVREYFAEQLLDIYKIGLDLCEGNHSKVARFLGMDRKMLDRQLEWARSIIGGVG
jgi:DNA-binding NtrC family response regulator